MNTKVLVGFLAGAMTVRTKERRIVDSTEAYHVAIQAQSVGLVRSFIYEVDDIYESFINTTTLRPFRAENRVNHGNKQKQTSLMIDTRRQIARLADGQEVADCRVAWRWDSRAACCGWGWDPRSWARRSSSAPTPPPRTSRSACPAICTSTSVSSSRTLA